MDVCDRSILTRTLIAHPRLFGVTADYGKITIELQVRRAPRNGVAAILVSNALASRTGPDPTSDNVMTTFYSSIHVSQ